MAAAAAAAGGGGAPPAAVAIASTHNTTIAITLLSGRLSAHSQAHSELLRAAGRFPRGRQQLRPQHASRRGHRSSTGALVLNSTRRHRSTMRRGVLHARTHASRSVARDAALHEARVLMLTTSPANLYTWLATCAVQQQRDAAGILCMFVYVFCVRVACRLELVELRRCWRACGAARWPARTEPMHKRRRAHGAHACILKASACARASVHATVSFLLYVCACCC